MIIINFIRYLHPFRSFKKIHDFLEGGGYMKQRSTVRTTLYELIQAINEQLPPEEDGLVPGIVLHMLATGQIKFIHNLN